MEVLDERTSLGRPFSAGSRWPASRPAKREVEPIHLLSSSCLLDRNLSFCVGLINQ